MQDTIKYVNKLLKISDSVIKEMDILSNLSYNNREHTEQFLDHVNDVRYYLNQESILLNNISLEFLNKIYDYLIEHDDMSDGYARAIMAVLEKIEELDEMPLAENTYEEENLEEDEEEIVTEFDILSEYMEKEDNDDDKIRDYATDYIATLAVKKMLNRIKSVYTDNKTDKKYKERLIKYFNRFKYYYFTMDMKLERLGVQYDFNVDRMPNLPLYQYDMESIFNNECVNIINNMYLMKNNEYDIEKISKALFEMMTFEEYIEGLNSELINKLLELCYRLDSISKNSFYGNIVKSKLLAKKKN